MDEAISVAICEDSEPDAAQLMLCIDTCGIPARYELFKNGEEFLAAFQGQYEVVFMDIYMGGASGVDVVSELRKLDENVVVAFTTTSPDYALEGYRLGVLKYLEKPVSCAGVKDTLMLALMKRQMRPKIILRTGGSQRQVMLDSVLYFEQRDHAVLVHTTNETFRTSQSVKINDIENELKDKGFLRCHHSFVVNLQHVARLESDFVMENGAIAHIRQSDYKRISDEYKRYLIGRTRNQIGNDCL